MGCEKIMYHKGDNRIYIHTYIEEARQDENKDSTSGEIEAWEHGSIPKMNNTRCNCRGAEMHRCVQVQFSLA